MPAGYPLMPLTIRVRTGLAYISADILQDIQQSQLFFDRMGIQLRLYDNRVEYDERLPTAAENIEVDALVSKTWTPGQYWVDVVYFGKIHNAENKYDQSLTGYTSVPGSQKQNIGVLVAKQAHRHWSILAHELCHALGLPHAFKEGESTALLSNGERYIDAVMYPFFDETEFLTQENRSNNIMYHIAPLTTPVDAGITHTQIERVRLTLISRIHNFARINDEQAATQTNVNPLSFWPQPDTPSQILRSCFG